MRIAIIGTRGIPNNYGGFEQLAQYLSLGLHARGHEVYVYSSHRHQYQEKTWKGIHIVHKYDPEKRLGSVGQFIYDLNSIWHSRKQHFDVILNLGYTSSSVWMRLFPGSALVITNMDGLEWKRSKYSAKVQEFLKYAEKLAVKLSDKLVADSRAIQHYLKNKYAADSTFIAYGADLFSGADETVLSKFGTRPYGYNMLIARMEPENNLEMVLDGVVLSSDRRPFYVIGNATNRYGNYLQDRYKNDMRVVFTGPNYDLKEINNLRYFCNLYFHGHSVGGTNPSLLEAMGCSSLIAAHDNQFNRSVLGDESLYFSDARQVAQLLDDPELVARLRPDFTAANRVKIRDEYSWPKIVSDYEALMLGS